MKFAVDSLDPDEVARNPLFSNILHALRHNPPFSSLVVSFILENGELVERQVSNIFSAESRIPEALTNGIHRQPIMFPVKLIHKDGTWEVGLKETCHASVSTGHRDLVSYYIRDGIMNPSTGKWESPHTLYKFSYPKNMKNIHMFNGDVDCIGRRRMTEKEYEDIWIWLNNSHTVYKEIGTPSRMIYGIERIKVEKPEYWSGGEPEGYHRWDMTPPVFMTYLSTRYLKSIYVHERKLKLVSKIYRLQDLASIRQGDPDPDDDEPMEIWNSLDATIHDGLYK